MKLALVEFKRALLLLGVATVAGVAIVLLIERILVLRGQFPDTVAGAVDLFLLTGVILMGYAGGERAFSREFKERDLPLVETFPLPRWRIWLSVVMAHYGAVLVCTALVCASRPQAVMAHGATIHVVLIVQFCLFSMACAFAPLFLRPVVTYSVAIAIAGVIFLEAMGGNANGILELYAAAESSLALTRLIECGAVTIFVLPVFYLGLSLLFFVRGELLLTRRRLKNGVVLVVAAIGFVALARVYAAGVDAMQPYHLARAYPRGSPSVFVHPEGQRVCLVEWSDSWVVRSRLEMLDLDSGRRLGSLNWRELRPLGWVGDGTEFLALGLEPRYLVSLDLLSRRSTWLISIDLDGKTHRHLDIGERNVVSVNRLASPDRFLLITDNDGVCALSVLDGRQREIEEVASAPCDGYQMLRDTSEGLFVRLSDSAVGYSAWLFGEDPFLPSTIPLAKTSGRLDPDLILDGRLHSRDGEAASALLDRLSRPEQVEKSEQVRGIYKVPTVVREDTPVFYVETSLETGRVRLFVRRLVDPHWTLVDAHLPSSSRYLDAVRAIPEREMIESRVLIFMDGMALDLVGGIAAFVSEGPEGYRLVLFDANRAVRRELAEFPRLDLQDHPDVRLARVPTIHGVLLGVWYGDSTTFRYDPATGAVEPVKVMLAAEPGVGVPVDESRKSHIRWSYSWPSLLYRDSQGVELHHIEDEIVRSYPDGRRESFYPR